MEATLNLVLFKGKTHTDGTHPIQLQFNVPGMQPQRKGIYKCYTKDWDNNSKRVLPKTPNSAFINNMLSEQYLKYERKKLQVLNDEIPPDNFFGKKATLTLDSIIQAEMDRFEAKLQTGAYKRFEGYQKDLREYFGSTKLNIARINLNWYEKYAEFLGKDIIEDGKKVKKKNIGATIQKKIKTIRRLVEKYSGVVPTDEIKSFRVAQKKPVKHKWTSEELDRFETLELEPYSLLSIVRDFFMLQIYLRGSRVGALVQAYCHQFENGRYQAFNEDGTKNNVSCKLVPVAQEIVDKYKGKYERLFPFFKFTPDPKASDFENKRKRLKLKESATSVINNALKVLAKKADIKKKASSHLARHIFTKKAIDKVNNPMVTMELLGHKSLAVHQQYLNDVRNDDVLDDATDEIFS
jgi:integrase/recombinase XerD